MFATRGSQSLTGFTHVGARSHVLLAACKSTELALESDGRGHFSAQFLALLKDKRPDKLRYCDVIGNLTLKDGFVKNSESASVLTLIVDVTVNILNA